jgi:hypothetical protein
VTYRGDLANLPDSHYALERRYLWGLCVYHYIADDLHAAYPVVSYVVEPADDLKPRSSARPRLARDH